MMQAMLSKMIRLFIYLPREQAEWMRQEAARRPRGTTQSSIAREAIEAYQTKCEAGKPAEGGLK
jgi:hypothetical protein